MQRLLHLGGGVGCSRGYSSLLVLQVLVDPSVVPFYFGPERAMTLEYKDGIPPPGFPRPEELPLPGSTWKDFSDMVNQPFEGQLKAAVSLGVSPSKNVLKLVLGALQPTLPKSSTW